MKASKQGKVNEQKKDGSPENTESEEDIVAQQMGGASEIV